MRLKDREEYDWMLTDTGVAHLIRLESVQAGTSGYVGTKACTRDGTRGRDRAYGVAAASKAARLCGQCRRIASFAAESRSVTQ